MLSGVCVPVGRDTLKCTRRQLPLPKFVFQADIYPETGSVLLGSRGKFSVTASRAPVEVRKSGEPILSKISFTAPQHRRHLTSRSLNSKPGCGDIGMTIDASFVEKAKLLALLGNEKRLRPHSRSISLSFGKPRRSLPAVTRKRCTTQQHTQAFERSSKLSMKFFGQPDLVVGRPHSAIST